MIVFGDCDSDGFREVDIVGGFHIVRVEEDAGIRTYEDRHFIEWHFHIAIPSIAFQTLSREEVHPETFRQIDIAATFTIHDWTDEELLAEIVLVVDMPHLTVVRMADQQGLNHREPTAAGFLRLVYDVRYEAVTQFPPSFYDGGDGRIMPGLALETAMIADVRGEDTKLRPAHIAFLVEW